MLWKPVLPISSSRSGVGGTERQQISGKHIDPASEAERQGRMGEGSLVKSHLPYLDLAGAQERGNEASPARPRPGRGCRLVLGTT